MVRLLINWILIQKILINRFSSPHKIHGVITNNQVKNGINLNLKIHLPQIGVNSILTQINQLRLQLIIFGQVIKTLKILGVIRILIDFRDLREEEEEAKEEDLKIGSLEVMEEGIKKTVKHSEEIGIEIKIEEVEVVVEEAEPVTDTIVRDSVAIITIIIWTVVIEEIRIIINHQIIRVFSQFNNQLTWNSMKKVNLIKKKNKILL